MTHEKKQKILDKVKKLLALSQSPNEHEAALAAARAHELLLKYNLSVAEIKAEGDVVMLDAICESSSWMRMLMNSVCKAFYCQTLLRDGSTALVIIGVAADAKVALYTFQYLYDTVIRLVGNFMKGVVPDGKGVLTSYCLGVVSSISDTLDTMVARNEQASPEGPSAIVLMRKAREGRIDDFLREEVKVTGEFRRGKTEITDPLAYRFGRVDGRAVKIAKGGALA